MITAMTLFGFLLAHAIRDAERQSPLVAKLMRGAVEQYNDEMQRLSSRSSS
jgi:hypothetical protein